ncbi:MAG: L,D-transpeptidase family protein [Bacteroidaceae bacterium]|nr:L,D-transpeptidase family protein [Bacteroidaceae bacterium]
MTLKAILRPSVVVLSLLLCVGCERMFGPTEADLSAFGEYVYRLDTAQLRQQFSERLNADDSHDEALNAIRQCYSEQSNQDRLSLWFTRMGVADDAETLLAWLRREVPLAGLDTTAFHISEIADDLHVVRLLAFDSLGIDINTLLPRLDYNLTHAYVCYAVGQRFGFVNPDKLLNRLDRQKEGEKYIRLFDYEVKAPDYSEAIRHLLADGRMDYLQLSAPDDPVYTALQNRLSSTTDVAARHTLAVNMERCRWQLKKPLADERMVLVNLPSQQLWCVCPDSVVNMRICFGKTRTKTPLLQSDINRVEVNPDWIITPNIIKNEVSVHAGDSAYFARNRYYIVDMSTGDTLNPAHVGVSQLKSGRLRVGQRGGAGNSLGRIVFRFPNNFSVYLHDTSNRSAFNLEQRTLSHGCVRVQKPFELACFLMPDMEEWDVDQLRLSMDIKPETERGKKYLEEHQDDRRPLRLIRHRAVKPSMPLYIVYYTAYPNPENGNVEFWNDVYGYDAVITSEGKRWFQ